MSSRYRVALGVFTTTGALVIYGLKGLGIVLGLSLLFDQVCRLIGKHQVYMLGESIDDIKEKVPHEEFSALVANLAQLDPDDIHACIV